MRYGVLSVWMVSALAVSAPALAQDGGVSPVNDYSVSSENRAFVGLAGGVVDTAIRVNQDEGSSVIPLGFTFPYYGANYTQVTVNTNGLILFDQPSADKCTYPNNIQECYQNRAIPKANLPDGGGPKFHSFIAPWWDDSYQFGTGANASDTQLIVLKRPGEITFEFRSWGYFNAGGNRFTYQVTLSSSGMVNVHYGSHTSASYGEASSGFEDSTGANGGTLVTCVNPIACKSTDWPANRLYTFGRPNSPDLVVREVNLVGGAEIPNGSGGSNLELTIEPTLANEGTVDGTGAIWKAYLSTDTTLDGSDQLIHTSTTPLDVPARSAITVSQVVTTPAPTGSGSYYVLVQASGMAGEASTANNVRSNRGPLKLGVDLVALSVSGPTTTIAPGDTVNVTAQFGNEGLTADATATVEILLSADETFSGTDAVVHSETISIGGAATLNRTFPVTVTGNVPNGEAFWLLRIVPSAGVTELSTTNNVVASTSSAQVVLPDLEIVSIRFVEPENPAASTSVGYLGEPARVLITYKNSGQGAAPAFDIGIGISDDANWSALGDTLAYRETVPSLPAGGTGSVDLTFPLPLVDRKGVPFVTRGYYVMGMLDSRSWVAETSNNNNNEAVKPQVLLRAPAPDYTVAEVDAPDATAVGEVIPVFRVIRNIGNRPGGEVRYRYVASANNIITNSDIPLEILGPTGVVSELPIQLFQGNESGATEFVRLPPQMPAGNYYIGIIVDEAQAVEELEEGNNAISSNATIAVAEGAMRIVSDTLPDAILGAPYFYRLAVVGAQGAVTWGLEGADVPIEGVSLRPDGTIRGTPTLSSVSAFTVKAVDEQGRSAIRRLVLRALPTTSELVITTQTLPPVIASSQFPYSASVSATGGVMPYTWSTTSVFPNRITLAPDGTLSGALMNAGATPREEKVTVKVVDAVGSSATKTLTLKIIPPGGLVIAVLALPDGMTGQAYTADIVAQNVSGEPLQGTLQWEVVAGRLPAGLKLEFFGNTVLLSGTPTEEGTSRFSLEVRDSTGRSDLADFVFHVHAGRLLLKAKEPFTQVGRGQEVKFQIISERTSEPVAYHLESGALPAGLELTADGFVQGTVAEDAKLGLMNFIVEGVDAKGSSGLGAFAIDVGTVAPAAVGCSSTGSSSTGWLMLLALPVFLLGRRSRRAAVTVAAVSVLALPAVGNAQTVTYTRTVKTNVPFEPLSSGGTIGANGALMPLQFDFQFYGTAYNSVGISPHGFLTLGSLNHTSTNKGIPSSSTSSGPTSFIAPWWDNLKYVAGGGARWYLYGTSTEPPFKKVFVIEWTGAQYNTTSTTSPNGPFSFQVHLYEGSNKIKFAYGYPALASVAKPSASSSATVGIQPANAATNALAGLTDCVSSSSGTCKDTHFVPDSIIEFTVPPDLKAVSLAADTTGYAGLPLKARFEVANVGGRPVTSSVRTALYLSTDPVFDASDVRLSPETSGLQFEVGTTVNVDLNVTVPPTTTIGTYYLFAKADDLGSFTELNESNNVSDPFQIRIAPGTADLSVLAIATPAASVPGSTLSVDRTIGNGGSANAVGSVRYTYLLSDNSAVSLSDRALGSFALNGLAAGSQNQQTDTVKLPDSLAPGRYWLGVCVDFDPTATPNSAVAEISEVNNCLGTQTSFVVGTSELAIITASELTSAAQFAPFGERLEAIGGDGTYTWSVVGGSIPAGLELKPDGRLEGSPGSAGAFSFTAEVQSGAGTTPQRRDFELSVVPAAIALAVAPQDLPLAEFGQPYAGRLVAVGGKPPYAWTLIEDSLLPSGLTLSSEGLVEGRAGETGNFPIRVQVTDRAGASAAAMMSVRAVAPTTLSIASTRLRTAYVAQQYFERLQAVGGRAPYNFEVTAFQQLPVRPTDVVQPRREKSPETPNVIPDNFGVVLREFSDLGEWVFEGTPQIAGTFALRVKVTDDNGSVDETTLILQVSYNKGLQLTTSLLPDAFVGQEYQVRLSSNALQGTAVKFELACLQQATTDLDGSECVEATGGTLPKGITLGEDGSLTGVPEGEPSPTGELHSVMIRVTDPTGRQDVRSLTLKLRQPVAPKGGCAGGGAVPSAFALAAAAMALLRRRSRR